MSVEAVRCGARGSHAETRRVFRSPDGAFQVTTATTGDPLPLTSDQKADRARERQLATALKEETRAKRLEARSREWATKDMYLSREEAANGEPCRGCGLPVVDNLGDWPATMYLSRDERIEYDVERARFRERHPDCESHLWSMVGSRATHCGDCCPPLPLSEAQLEYVARILRRSRPSVEELDVWECLLTCGHQIQQQVHHTSSGPGFSTYRCLRCDELRGVVSSEKIVEVGARKQEAERRRASALARAVQELERAEKTARDARLKLDQLLSQSVDGS